MTDEKPVDKCYSYDVTKAGWVKIKVEDIPPDWVKTFEDWLYWKWLNK